MTSYHVLSPSAQFINLLQPRKGKPTILRDQFKKLELTAPVMKPTDYSHGSMEENMTKNRDETVLPCKFGLQINIVFGIQILKI